MSTTLPTSSTLIDNRTDKGEQEPQAAVPLVTAAYQSLPESSTRLQSDGDRSEIEVASTKRKHNAMSIQAAKRQRLSPAASFLAPGANTTAQDRPSEALNGPSNPENESSGAGSQRAGSVASEAQMGEILKNSISGPSTGPEAASPEQNYRLGQSYSLTGDGKLSSPTGSSAQQTQRDGGQRKRNFSNRTKTGCLTCRERKKKCDERKPHCANCERGGFPCKGYATNGTFKTPIASQLPLQPVQNSYHNPAHFFQTAAHPAYYDPASQLPLNQDPQIRSQAYVNQQWAAPPQASHYTQEPMHRSDFQPIAAQPPIVVAQPVMAVSDQARQQLSQKMHPPPEPVHPPHTRTSSSHAAYPQYGAHMLPNGQPFAYDSRITAQLALDASARPPSTEKGKMLAGFPFNQRDPDLKQERNDCAQRVYRFNKSASEPGFLAESSRREQLRQILEPHNATSPSSKKSPSSRAARTGGSLGDNVEIEAPFFCDYGYNITIRNDVDIGANCRVMDASTVEIGERTIIGPDVKILTVDGQHYDSHRGADQKRALRAQRVKIGKDVFIGAGVIILPGRTIADGATIGAGTIVHHDVKGPHTYINNLADRKPRNDWTYQDQQAQMQAQIQQQQRLQNQQVR